MKNLILIAVLALGLTACSTIGPILEATCTATLGGSVAGENCDKIGELINKAPEAAE